MATLNIKNQMVVKLAEEVSRITGESRTEAIRRALEERKQRLTLRVSRVGRPQRLEEFLEQELWAQIPSGVLGTTLSKEQEEELLGFGQTGV
ncbi:MAG: type II toxin-antitoxin system VapB family antitoxin [Acidobacteriota bacterium]